MLIPILINDKEFIEKLDHSFDVVIIPESKFSELVCMSNVDAAKWIMKNKKKYNGYDFSKGFEKTSDPEDNLAILWNVTDPWKSKVNVFVQLEAEGKYPEGWYEMESKTDWLRDVLKSS